MREQSFKKDDETFTQSFVKWWENNEPMGYDHPNTREPIVDTLIEADEGTKELERQNKLLREALEIYANEDNWYVSYPNELMIEQYGCRIAQEALRVYDNEYE